MATKNITICDRCGDECVEKYGRRDVRITINGKRMDLCPSCGNALAKWLERDNTTTPGGYGPGWEERCTHNIPCAGPCNSAGLHKVE